MDREDLALLLISISEIDGNKITLRVNGGVCMFIHKHTGKTILLQSLLKLFKNCVGYGRIFKNTYSFNTNLDYETDIIQMFIDSILSFDDNYYLINHNSY